MKRVMTAEGASVRAQETNRITRYPVACQRGILCWVAPNTSPYGGVGSYSFLELLKKNPERGLLRSAMIRRPLAVYGHHMRIAQFMTIAWFKFE